MKWISLSFLLMILLSSCSLNKETVSLNSAIEAYKLTHIAIVPLMEDLLQQYESSSNGGDSIIEDLIISANNGTETRCGISRESNSRTFRYKVTYIFDNVELESEEYQSLNGELTVVEDCLSPENINCIEARFNLTGKGEVRDVLLYIEVTESLTFIEINDIDMSDQMRDTVRELAHHYTRISRRVLQ